MMSKYTVAKLHTIDGVVAVINIDYKTTPAIVTHELNNKLFVRVGNMVWRSSHVISIVFTN